MGWAMNMRQRLKDEGVLERKGDTLVFTSDAEFTSPSSAAAVDSLRTCKWPHRMEG